MTGQPIPLPGETLFPREPMLILDPRDPLRIARELVARTYTDAKGNQTLRRHRGAFWKHTGCYYAIAEDESIAATVWTFLEPAMRLDDKDKPEPFKPKRSIVCDIMSALQAVTALDDHIAPPAWIGPDADLPPAEEFFSCANGLLHLPTGDLYPSTPNYFGLAASEVRFDPNAPEPVMWLKFLADIFEGDPDAIDLLQDWAGLILSPDTCHHKILLISGPTRSGKGTIARVLTALAGRDSVAGPTLAGLATHFGLEPLIGKPLAIISDARLGGRSDQAAITERLLSISGEDALTIDRKHRAAWTGRLPTRFTILTNELPRLADSSGAIVGRFLILLLVKSFYGKEDHLLTAKLLDALPGILNWARGGYCRLRERGYFQQPESAHEAIRDLQALASPVMAFVRERCTLKPGHSALVDDLYAAYKEWCADNGRREPSTKQTFCRDLHAAFPAIETRQSRDDDRARRYWGIGLL